MKIMTIARIVHEIQQSFCISIGDNSLPDWEDAGAMQENTYAGVQFLIRNPDAKAGASHEAWMENKMADGWKKGPVKDWDKKEHPALIPFEELPQHEQTKDYLFVQTVRSLEPFIPAKF